MQDNNTLSKKDLSKVIDYVPVRKKHQLIIPFTDGKYQFSETDRRYLIRITNNQQRVDKTILKVKTDNGLNPVTNHYIKILRVLLYFAFSIVLVLLLYLLLGIFIFFLGDPVICFLYIYFVMVQVWWRGGRVLIEWVIESKKCNSLKKYLENENKNFYSTNQVVWSVGGKGKWIQVDNRDTTKG